MSGDSRRPGALPIVVAVAGLALIGLGQGIWNRHSIEDDLTSASASALRSAGVDGVQVSFTGRDASLKVPDPAAAQQAVSVVEGVTGVRVASAYSTSVVIPPFAPATPEPASPAPGATGPDPGPSPAPAGQLPIGLTFEDGTLTLTGSVPSEQARAAVIEAAGQASYSWKVADKLTIDPALPPAPDGWFSTLTDFVDAVPGDTSKLVARFQDQTVLLRGTPATGALEQNLLAAAAGTVGGAAGVLDGLDVPAT